MYLNMKKYISGLLVIAAMASVACNPDLLNEPQKGVVDMESFYKTPEDAESAVITAYKAAKKCYDMGSAFDVSWCIAPPLFILENAPSDDIYYGSGNKDDHVFGLEINEFRDSYTSNNIVVGNLYYGLYQMIYACNLVTDHFQYGEDAVINRAVAEASCLRAFAHFKLYCLWGDAPLVDHVLVGSDKPGNTPRAELLDWVISEFGTASKYLPSKSGLNDSELAIRFTKEAALAFKGKAEVFKGDYAAAKESLGAVIASGKYDLVPGAQMHDLFHMAGDGNMEKIFEFNYVNNPGNDPGFSDALDHFQVNQSCFWRDLYLPSNTIQAVGWGGINPTKEFGDALIANDGINSFRRKAWILTYDDLILHMPYANDATMNNDAKKMADKSRGINAKTGVFGNAGYWSYKRVPLKSDLIANHSYRTQENSVVMRYAEVLLLYAEACAWSTDDAGKGLAALQKVQQRAGSNHVSTALSKNEVKNEKRFELYLEGSRFFDLVRWGDAATVLANNGKSVPTAYDKINDGGATHELEIKWSSYNKTYGFKAGKNENVPYPFAETSVNPNIVQNIGW